MLLVVLKAFHLRFFDHSFFKEGHLLNILIIIKVSGWFLNSISLKVKYKVMIFQKQNFKNVAFLILMIVPLFITCTKDDNGVLFVDEELVPYFDRFIAEGASRGVTVDLVEAEIEGRIKDFLDVTVLGHCQQEPNEPKQIVVDSEYWNEATELEREFVVFHELGHCYLQKGHTDSGDGDGNCISIMQSGTGLCNNNYTEETREELIDELFQ